MLVGDIKELSDYTTVLFRYLVYTEGCQEEINLSVENENTILVPKQVYMGSPNVYVRIMKLDLGRKL
jgi:hypothetical protein